jgi:hypothetical protein
MESFEVWFGLFSFFRESALDSVRRRLDFGVGIFHREGFIVEWIRGNNFLSPPFRTFIRLGLMFGDLILRVYLSRTRFSFHTRIEAK